MYTHGYILIEIAGNIKYNRWQTLKYYKWIKKIFIFIKLKKNARVCYTLTTYRGWKNKILTP